MSKSVQLYSAIESATKRIVSIDEVDIESNGLKCGCECPICGGRLVAKKKHRTPHFAHHSGAKAECEWAHETMLHLMAKQALEDKKRMIFPELEISIEIPWLTVRSVAVKGGVFELDNVEIEPTRNGFRPDLCVYIKNTPCYIEICVTHPVSEEKLSKVVKEGVSMLEIDLGDLPRNVSPIVLGNILENEPERMTWLYNRKAETEKARTRALLDWRRRNASSIRLTGFDDHRTHWVHCPLDNTCVTPFDPYCLNPCEHFLGFAGRPPASYEALRFYRGKFLCDARAEDDCDCRRHQNYQRRSDKSKALDP